MNTILQYQYDQIYAYFKTTTEPFDLLDWDGRILRVWCKNSIVEIYNKKALNFLLKV